MRKLKGSGSLTSWEMTVFIDGTTWLRPEWIDVNKALEKWPEHKEKFMEWWNGQEDIPPFCPEYKRWPKERREGVTPFALRREETGEQTWEEKLS